MNRSCSDQCESNTRVYSMYCSSEEEPWRTSSAVAWKLRRAKLSFCSITASRRPAEASSKAGHRCDPRKKRTQLQSKVPCGLLRRLAADGWIRRLRDHLIDYSWAEKFRKGALWSVYTVGQSLASCYPEKCIQFDCDCFVLLVCVCMWRLTLSHCKMYQLSLPSELRTPLWLANQLFCVCTAIVT